jgi:hypothetical protein
LNAFRFVFVQRAQQDVTFFAPTLGGTNDSPLFKLIE